MTHTIIDNFKIIYIQYPTNISKIINVDVEYKEREKLRVASQTDSLTGLFNKGSVDLNIADKLSANPDFTYICWVLDVDDFKIIKFTTSSCKH